jgi:hypothetical protein
LTHFFSLAGLTKSANILRAGGWLALPLSRRHLMEAVILVGDQCQVDQAE